MSLIANEKACTLSKSPPYCNQSVATCNLTAQRHLILYTGPVRSAKFGFMGPSNWIYTLCLSVFINENTDVISISSSLSVTYLFIQQERDPSSVSCATSPPPRSPTYRGTNVFTPGRNHTAAPGATTGTGSLTSPRLVALMAATMALMIRGLIGGGRMVCVGGI